jgi:hypothetical protein
MNRCKPIQSRSRRAIDSFAAEHRRQRSADEEGRNPWDREN